MQYMYNEHSNFRLHTCSEIPQAHESEFDFPLNLEEQNTNIYKSICF